MSCACVSIASATESGVTVRQVITCSTGAAGSPSKKPTLSQSAASDNGAMASSAETRLATVVIGNNLFPADRHANQHHDQKRRDAGDEIMHQHRGAVALVFRGGIAFFRLLRQPLVLCADGRGMSN